MAGAAQTHEAERLAGSDRERYRADALGDEALDRQRDALAKVAPA